MLNINPIKRTNIMNEEITIVESAQALEAINRSEIDMQIATAKRFPRDIDQVLKRIGDLAARDQDTAADCFYSLPRDGKNIEGVSVRMAEIIASSWGNLRAASRIVGNDGKHITAQAICMDLETNVAISTEVKRRITDKGGRIYSDDMQVTTGNAASSIAFRNAVFKIVPKAITKEIVEHVKQVAIGRACDLETMRNSVINWFAHTGVSEADLLEFYGITGREAITTELCFEMKGLINASKEGTTSIEEAIKKPLAERRKAAIAAQEAEDNKGKVAKSMAKAEKGGK